MCAAAVTAAAAPTTTVYEGGSCKFLETNLFPTEYVS